MITSGLFRKGIEAWFTVIIELSWPKRRILEVYLNIAEFGPGIYGVPAASRIYFAKRPSQLTNADTGHSAQQHEAALITGGCVPEDVPLDLAELLVVEVDQIEVHLDALAGAGRTPE